MIEQLCIESGVAFILKGFIKGTMGKLAILVYFVKRVSHVYMTSIVHFTILIIAKSWSISMNEVQGGLGKKYWVMDR